MALPPGYTKGKPYQVYKLHKSLYGLKQASREWNEEFSKALVAYGFVQLENDYFLFVKDYGSSFQALVIYVDDVLIIGSNYDDIQALKNHLHQVFTIKDLGSMTYFPGLKVSYLATKTSFLQL